MKNIFLYQHGGCFNHGCEALARTVTNIIKEEVDSKVHLCSYSVEEDKAVKLDENCMDTIIQNDKVLKKYSLSWIIYQLDKRLTNSKSIQEAFVKEKTCINAAKDMDVVIAIGGDNYCYNKGKQYWPTDRLLKKNGAKMMIWGCSIEPKDLDAEFTQELSLFDILSVRESISADALKKAGLGDKVHLIPDPAFTLETTNLPLPEGFLEGNTVGINVSPMIIGCEEEGGVTMKNYTNLIQYILGTTDMNIALIPHVVWDYNDDRVPLRQLYDMYKDTGRVVMIEDHNCMELKGFISRLRMFVGARTHSTIAAYSSLVPTLVVGYSVKAKGIAKDLFGTYENYTIPVQSLQEENDLLTAFKWLQENEESIRDHLTQIMPDYSARALQAGKELKKLLEK